MRQYNLGELIYNPSKLRSGVDCEVVHIDNIKAAIQELKQTLNEANILNADTIINKIFGPKLT